MAAHSDPSGPWSQPHKAPPSRLGIPHSGPTSRAPRGRALVLDTSSSRAERTAFALEQVGLQPAVVRDASDVFHRVMEGGVELVVLQVPLREMSEVVFLKIVRSLAGARTLPIVLTSDIYEGDDPICPVCRTRINPEEI